MQLYKGTSVHKEYHMHPQLFSLYSHSLSFHPSLTSPAALSITPFFPMISAAAYTMMLSYRCKFLNSYRTNGCSV